MNAINSDLSITSGLSLINQPVMSDLTTSLFTSVPVSDMVKCNVADKLDYSTEFAVAGLMLKETLNDVKSNPSYAIIHEDEAENITSPNLVQKNMKLWQIKALKHAFLLQLSNHWLKPASYSDDDGSSIVEFYNQKNHFVFISDDEGIQLLWSDNDKTHSEYISDESLSSTALIQNVAKLMPNF